jgi:hypothetical protein
MAVNKYVLYCVTEQQFVTIWSQTRPIHCPNSVDHVIVDNTIGIVETLTPASVSITGIDTSTAVGYYTINGYNSSISSNAITNIDLLFPSSIFLYGMIFDGTTSTIGDRFDIILSPNKTASILTIAANIGDTIFNISSAALVNLRNGVYVTLNDGTNINNVGRIINIDIPNLRITTEFATTNSFLANTTIVVVNLYIAKNFIISSTNQYKIGYSRLAGRILPANTVIRIVYYNNSGVSKIFSYGIEINY